jgi:curved DNA-binding protein CbpA
LPAPGGQWWEILGVDRTAGLEQVRAAYLALAHENHPDKTGGDGEFMKRVNEAWTEAKRKVS